MLVKDYASLEAGIGKGEPSRLLIEIALRPASLAGPRPACDLGEVQRAIREGFREVLAQVDREPLARPATPPKIAGETVVRPSLRFCDLRCDRERRDPASIGVP